MMPKQLAGGGGKKKKEKTPKKWYILSQEAQFIQPSCLKADLEGIYK